jgi:5-methylthioribose kinase
LSSSIKVELKPDKKKFTNLRLCDIYAVSSFEDDYYFIIGDDYKMRRYNKSNFNILT